MRGGESEGGGDNLGSPKLKGGKGGEPPAALRGGSGLELQGQAGLTREFSYFLKNIYFLIIYILLVSSSALFLLSSALLHGASSTELCPIFFPFLPPPGLAWQY